MNIHEHQAKDLLAAYGVPVPWGAVAYTPGQALAAAREMGDPPWVLKAQIHAGGRGKAGGVKICRTLDDVRETTAAMLGATLVTRQTGPQGKEVRKILLEQGTDIADELYLAVALDREAGRLTLAASPDGGMDIEEVAAQSPERIFKARLDSNHRLWPFQARELLFRCGLTPALAAHGAQLAQNLARLCVSEDALLAEINPLAVTVHGELIALDAKLNFDDSALKRRPHIAAMHDPDEIDPLELKAAILGVNYVRLDGWIGTLVNGAGLAMATMDAIRQSGGAAANFLDAGGGASADMVKNGFEIMLSDSNVRGVLVNIFGGILRCDIVAEGVVRAVRELEISLPVVVRMEGTNVEEGRRILNSCGLNFATASSMSEAARLIVEKTRRE